jgi:hypothetical protein
MRLTVSCWKLLAPTPGSSLRAEGLGFGVEGLAFWVQGLLFRVQILGFRVWGSWFMVHGSWFVVHGPGVWFQSLGFRVQGAQEPIQKGSLKFSDKSLRVFVAYLPTIFRQILGEANCHLRSFLVP